MVFQVNRFHGGSVLLAQSNQFRGNCFWWAGHVIRRVISLRFSLMLCEQLSVHKGTFWESGKRSRVSPPPTLMALVGVQPLC